MHYNKDLIFLFFFYSLFPVQYFSQLLYLGIKNCWDGKVKLTSSEILMVIISDSGILGFVFSKDSMAQQGQVLKLTR